MLRGMQRIVYQRADGMWANKREGAAEAGTLHKTQAEAEAEARRMLERVGGGELTLMGESERLRPSSAASNRSHLGVRRELER
jgi:hypothetical protein